LTIWRNIIPHVAPVARCVAPDFVGFGKSGKPPIAYRFADHVRYLDAFLDGLGIVGAYLVAQDWGTALAFELARRRPAFVKGLAFMEFIRPMPTWEDFHQTAAESARAGGACDVPEIPHARDWRGIGAGGQRLRRARAARLHRPQAR
jgi:haloalkane dehalogenase